MACKNLAFNAKQRHGILLLLMAILGFATGLEAQSIGGLGAQYCVSDPVVPLSGNPTGGVFSGPGISGSSFNPTAAGVGSHTISYDPITYSSNVVSFTAITGGGTTISLADDANSAALPLGFNFNFYNNIYNQVYLSSNGFLSFDVGQSIGSYAQCLGNSASPSNAIFFYFADLDPGNGLQGTGDNLIWYSTVGTAPNREFRVTFWRVDQFPDGNNVTVRCRLFESNGAIRVDIQSAPSDGGNVTIGLEGVNGFHSAGPISCTNPGTITNRSYQFTRNAPVTASTTVFANPSAANAGGNQTVTSPSTTMAAAAPGIGTGTWSVVSGSGTFASPNSPTSTVTGLTPGPNTFRWTISNGPCSTTSDDVVITYNDDTTPPSVTCPSNQTGILNSNCQFALPDYRPLATVTDAVDPNPTVTQSPAPGTIVSGAGTVTTVTISATDAAGNTGSCNFQVTTVDNTPPAIACPSARSGSYNSNCQFVLPDYRSLVSRSDNCTATGSISLSQSPAPGTIVVASQTITMTATDQAGNSSTCNFALNLSDNTPPSALCQNLTVSLNSSGNASITASSVNNGSFDNCTGSNQLSISASPLSFNCSNVGANNVTLSVTDLAGNTSTCTAIVTVEDNTNPVATCQNVTAQLNASGTVSVPASAVNNGSSDACGIASLTLSPGTFNCSNVGSVGTVLTVTDNNGNSATCAATVSIEDNIAPSAICVPATVQLSAGGTGTVTVADVDGGSSDACGIASRTVSPNSFNCSNVGPNTVTLTVTDNNGNTSTCNSTVTVEDNVPPNAVCQNLTISLNPSGTANITTSTVNNGSSDACGIASFSLSQSSFNCSDVGSNTVTLTVTDVNGNSGTCSSTVLVQDITAPVASCQNATVYLDGAGAAILSGAAVGSGSTDACGIGSLSPNPSSFNCSNVGSNGVTLTVTDNNGNTSTCASTVSVQDTTPPTAICLSDTLQLNASGAASLSLADIDGGSSDNCSIASSTLSNQSFTCSNVGSNTVTLTLTDVNGNTSSCNANVVVEDNIPPTALCQNSTVQLSPSGTASIAPPDIDNGSSDACGILSLSVNPGSFNCSNVGNNTVTLFVSDVNGNTSSCTANVLVEDTVAPTAVCQNLSIYLDGAGNASITASDVDGGSADACGIVNSVVSPSSFTCANVGGNSVTLTVSDLNGNSSSCNATVTVLDTIAPTASCMNATVQLNSGGAGTITSADIDAGSSDNCTISSLVLSNQSFNCADVGSNSVVLTVNDVNGNSSTCTATVTVEDNVAPSMLCKNDTIQLSAGGIATISPSDVDNGSSDACGIATLSVSPDSFTCANVGSNVVTLSAVDVNGNGGSCTATVFVEDNTPPIALCQNVTLQLDSGGSASLNASAVDGGSSDACGIGSLSVSPSNFNCGNVGSNSVTLTVTDVNGNFATCSANVIVEDNEAPVALCQDITVQLDAAGSASITPSDVDGGSNDACGIASLAINVNSFSCADIDTNAVVLTVTDVNGNSSNCTATVTIEDTVAPVASCQDLTVQLDSNGFASISAGMVDNGSNDACGIASLSVSPSTFTCSNVGANTVTLTASDVNGNNAICTATVTVEDNVPPVALCQNITVQLDASGTASIAGADVDNGSSDACGIASLAVSPNSFTCSNVGANPVVLTVTDVNGNVSTCTSIVSIQDTVTPIALCQNVTVQLDTAGQGFTTAVAIDSGSNDACGIQSLSLNPTTFDCSNVGANTGTLTVTDVNGNVSTCTATVTVEDNVAPSALCQSITVQLDTSGAASIQASSIDGGSSDNCSIATLLASPSQFNCSDVGSNAVTLTVTDVNGNSDSCTATVLVEDNVPPLAVCQNITVQLDANGTASIAGADVDNGSSDACGIASLAVSPNSFTCSNIGANAVTLLVTDVNGNTDNCSATVVVSDTVAPAAICQNITIQLDGSGQASITAADVDNGSNDACGIAGLSATPTSFNCSNLGGNTVTLSVDDVNGNTSSCTAVVTVADTINPVITCPQPISTVNDPSQCGAVVSWAAAITNDNCSVDTVTGSANSGDFFPVGTTSVTLVASDIAGNTANCSFDITVSDAENPMITCPADTSFIADSASCSAVVGWNAPQTSDNCGIASVVSSIPQGATLQSGTTPVTYVVTDNAGNSDSCTFNVTVNAPAMAISASSQLYNCGYNLTCNGAQDGMASVAVTGGCSPYTFAWSNGATTASPTGLAAGSYSVTVTDGLGTVLIDSVSLSQPDPVVLSIAADSFLCAGDSTGAISTSVIGGNDCASYDYTWSTGAVTQDLIGVPAGTYSVTVTDVSSCSVIGNVTIQSQPLPALDLGQDTSVCAGIPLVLDAGAGFVSYQWSTGDQTQTIGLNTPGTYSVTIEDIFGCVNADTIEISTFIINDEIIDPRTSLSICLDDTLILTADPGYSSYNWSTGETTQAIAVAGFGGMVTVVATDSNGCLISDTVMVSFTNVNNPVPVVLPGSMNLCEGTTVDLDAGNGYFSYVWNTGDTGRILSVDSSGQYCVVVTNGFGCLGKSDTVTITQVPNPTPTISYQNGILSVNGSYAGYQWELNGVLIPGAILSTHVPQNAGWYSITVSDLNNCEGRSDSLFVDPTVSAEGPENELIGLELYPNPTTGIINVRTESPINWDVDITVMDVYGHIVKTFRLEYLVDAIELDLTDVANGMYLLKIEDKKGRSNMIRFMVE